MMMISLEVRGDDGDEGGSMMSNTKDGYCVCVDKNVDLCAEHIMFVLLLILELGWRLLHHQDRSVGGML